MADEAIQQEFVCAKQAKLEKYARIVEAVRSGRTQSDVSREFGTTPQRVSQICRAAKKIERARVDSNATWDGALERGEISVRSRNILHNMIVEHRKTWPVGEISILEAKAFWESLTLGAKSRYPNLGMKTIIEIDAFFAAQRGEATQ